MRGKIRFVEARIESGLVKPGGDTIDGTTKFNPGVRDNYHEFLKIRIEKLIRFVRYELKGDGVFLLRMVAWNSSGLIAVDLVTRLWDIYTGKSKVPKDQSIEDEKDPLLEKAMSIT